MDSKEQDEASRSRSGDSEPAEPPSSGEGDTERKRRLLSRVAAIFRERRRNRRATRQPDADDESGDQV
jgi:hypothetical protein